jgi:hypothetical protein
MTLLDKFRTQPPQKHADPGVRLAYVQELPIDERVLLAEMARDDADARVRRAAVAKLMDPAALAGVARSDPDEGVRDQARTMLRDIALDAFEGVPDSDSLAAVEALTDVKSLSTIAKTALREEVGLRALWRVSDPHAHGSIARHAQLEPVRLAALSALQDRGEILGVALNSDFKDTGIAAVERIDGRPDLEQIALRGKNKSAVKRARTLLREMDERAGAAAAAEAAEQARVRNEAADARAAAERDERAARQAIERAETETAEIARLQAAVRDIAVAGHVVSAVDGAEIPALAGGDDVSAVDAPLRADLDTAEGQADTRHAADEERERILREDGAEAERQQQAVRAEAQARDARARQEALARLQQLAVRLESLPARTDLTLKAGERALRDARTTLADLPALPSKRDHEEIAERLKKGQAALTTKVQELRELTDWQRWANLGVQEQLCAKMEALSTVESPAEIIRQVRELQEQWRAAGDVPRPQGDLLWRRFKTAHDVVWSRCEAHFAAEAAVRAENLAKKVALCEKAEGLADSTNWIPAAEEIKRLQSEWKTVGIVTRGQEKAIWERFRTACDRFFTRRQADLLEHKKRWAVNLEKKLALCAQVEALADSTDWDAAAAEIKRLQNEWKTVGPVKKTRSEAIWQRFRGACDQFFARYAQRHEIARGERVAAREAICAELEGLSADGRTPQELLAAVRALRVRWQQEIAARGVDRDRAAALDTRFAAAFAAVMAAAPEAFAGTDLDPDANCKRMETLVKRVEELAAPSRGGAANDASLSPTSRAAAMLKEALAANTIGGKADEEGRARAVAEEVRQAQANWARIGPVPEEARRALADRFARACRRATEKPVS